MQTSQARAMVENDEQAIRALVDRWLKASENDDLPTMLNLLDDDVIFMVPDKAPFGKEEFAQNYQQIKDTKLKTASAIQEIKVLDSWAWMRNFLKVTFTPSSGTPATHTGHVLTILRKDSNGKWLIVRDANLLLPDSKDE